jgi:endonuclease/exonuclease/phosphatase family metal-dependent hydrolase
MILLSLNLRGVGGTLKVASMRRLLRKTKPDIIFLQETLVDEKKARLFMLNFFPGWLSCVVSSVGNSGGLLVTWDPNKLVLDPFLCCGGILLSGSSLENNKQICLLNVYGPCNERKYFWEQVASRGLLAYNNLIVAGDLNFTTRADEVWGASTHLDKLVGFFKDLFQENHLVDFLPDVLVPTWRNGRAGVDNIAKRLDRILVSENLLSEVGRFRSWVEYPFISDHAPVVAQFEFQQFPWPTLLS